MFFCQLFEYVIPLVSDLQSAIDLIESLLYLMSHFFLAAFNILMCLGVNLFEFILRRVYSTSCMCSNIVIFFEESFWALCSYHLPVPLSKFSEQLLQCWGWWQGPTSLEWHFYITGGVLDRSDSLWSACLASPGVNFYPVSKLKWGGTGPQYSLSAMPAVEHPPWKWGLDKGEKSPASQPYLCGI